MDAREDKIEDDSSRYCVRARRQDDAYVGRDLPTLQPTAARRIREQGRFTGRAGGLAPARHEALPWTGGPRPRPAWLSFFSRGLSHFRWLSQVPKECGVLYASVALFVVLETTAANQTI